MNMDVLVQYFARRNLGDDLFIHILAGAFPDCRLRLVGHPFFHPRGLPENVTLHPVSWSRLAWRCVQRVIGRDSALSHRIGKRNLYRLRSLADRSEAYVNIGGSIFVDQGGAEILCYNGDPAPVLEAIAAADHVIAGCFHAMILALSWGKAVFPIAYDCKTRHYLEDLRFPGRWAAPADLSRLTPADVLENYDRRVICDCAAHRQHAGNQLRALRTFVDAHKGQTNA